MAKTGETLTSKQRKFCEEFAANSGDATAAALKAGYSKSYAATKSAEILKAPVVAQYIKELTRELDATKIAKIEEIQSFWTKIVRGELDDGDYPAKLSDRIKASEILARSQGAFIEKLQVTGANGESLPSISLNFVKPEQMTLVE